MGSDLSLEASSGDTNFFVKNGGTGDRLIVPSMYSIVSIGLLKDVSGSMLALIFLAQAQSSDDASLITAATAECAGI